MRFSSLVFKCAKAVATIENVVLLATFASTLGLAILQILLRNFFDMGLICSCSASEMPSFSIKETSNQIREAEASFLESILFVP